MPGLEIRKRQVDRLLALERPAEDAKALGEYLELFAPIEELIRLRIRAGREGDFEEARQLEVLMDQLGDEQTQAARRFGLRDCGKDFTARAAFPDEPSD